MTANIDTHNRISGTQLEHILKLQLKRVWVFRPDSVLSSNVSHAHSKC